MASNRADRRRQIEEAEEELEDQEGREPEDDEDEDEEPDEEEDDREPDDDNDEDDEEEDDEDEDDEDELPPSRRARRMGKSVSTKQTPQENYAVLDADEVMGEISQGIQKAVETAMAAHKADLSELIETNKMLRKSLRINTKRLEDQTALLEQVQEQNEAITKSLSALGGKTDLVKATDTEADSAEDTAAQTTPEAKSETEVSTKSDEVLNKAAVPDVTEEKKDGPLSAGQRQEANDLISKAVTLQQNGIALKGIGSLSDLTLDLNHNKLSQERLSALRQSVEAASSPA